MRENKAKVKRIVAKATKPIEIGQKITFGNLGGLQNPQDPPPPSYGPGVSGLREFNRKHEQNMKGDRNSVV